jgi:hypothetical protein
MIARLTSTTFIFRAVFFLVLYSKYRSSRDQTTALSNWLMVDAKHPEVPLNLDAVLAGCLIFTLEKSMF